MAWKPPGYSSMPSLVISWVMLVICLEPEGVGVGVGVGGVPSHTSSRRLMTTAACARSILPVPLKVPLLSVPDRVPRLYQTDTAFWYSWGILLQSAILEVSTLEGIWTPFLDMRLYMIWAMS